MTDDISAQLARGKIRFPLTRWMRLRMRLNIERRMLLHALRAEHPWRHYRGSRRRFAEGMSSRTPEELIDALVIETMVITEGKVSPEIIRQGTEVVIRELWPVENDQREDEA